MSALTLLLALAAVGAAAIGLSRRAAHPDAPARVTAPAPLPFLALAAWAPRAVPQALRLPGTAGRILRAGLDGAVTSDQVARARFGLLTVAAPPAVVLAVLLPALAPVIITGVVLSAGAPDLALMRHVGARRAALRRELPDVLDILGICLESGMALDPAARLVADRLGGELGAELSRALRDIALGASRGRAFRDLADRCDLVEVTQFVGALAQAEDLGTPLSGALAAQAAAARAARREHARERAAKAAPKIQLVVALMMVPGALILILGALAIELSRQIGAVTGG
jgi:tight adherence protein C